MRKNADFISRCLAPLTSLLTTNRWRAATLFLLALSSWACSQPPANEAGKQAGAAPPVLPAQVSKETKNPLPDLAAAAAVGKPLYQAHCALCHGETGQSDGPASASYDPKPAALTTGAAAAQTDGELFLVTKNGKGKMPPTKRLTDEQIWQVVSYVRTLAQK